MNQVNRAIGWFISTRYGTIKIQLVARNIRTNSLELNASIQAKLSRMRRSIQSLALRMAI